MNHFQQLIIENFQSHGYTVIDFSPGLNVFVGPSDSGKSSILRALRWLLFNLPRGSDFIRSGEKECRVTLIFQDGSQVIRTRGMSSNRYLLRMPTGEDRVFEGFGNEVPEEIINIHNIRALKMDGRELLVHLGTQLESPFLLFDTAGNKAKTIGRVSGAHLIDKAFKKTSNDRQAMNSEIKRIDQESKDLRGKLKAYDDLPGLEIQLYQIEKLLLDAKAHQKKMERLRKLNQNLLAIRQEREKIEKWIGWKEKILLADRLIQRIEKNNAFFYHTSRLSTKWWSTQNEKEACWKRLKRRQNVFDAEENIKSLVVKQHRFIQLEKLNTKRNAVKIEKLNIVEKVKGRKGVLRIDQGLRNLEQKTERMNQLSQLNNRLCALQKEKRVVHDVFIKAKNVGSVDKIISHMMNRHEYLQRLSLICQRKEEIASRLMRGSQFRSEKEKEIAGLVKIWVQALTDLKKCPTCGSGLNSSTMDDIINEYRGRNNVAAGSENSTD